ncbi:hypothetical protein KAR91_20110 [Candidatus Pacearchaeota archaeon]|nr:hypothetical protein [Candidatus Pacearchaeota archaeon]
MAVNFDLDATDTSAGAFQGLLNKFGDIPPVIGNIEGSLGVVGTSLGQLGPVAEKFGGKIGGVLSKISLALGPIALGVTAVGIAWALFKKNTDDAKDSLDKLSAAEKKRNKLKKEFIELQKQSKEIQVSIVGQVTKLAGEFATVRDIQRLMNEAQLKLERITKSLVTNDIVRRKLQREINKEQERRLALIKSIRGEADEELQTQLKFSRAEQKRLRDAKIAVTEMVDKLLVDKNKLQETFNNLKQQETDLLEENLSLQQKFIFREEDFIESRRKEALERLDTIEEIDAVGNQLLATQRRERANIEIVNNLLDESQAIHVRINELQAKRGGLNRKEFIEFIRLNKIQQEITDKLEAHPDLIRDALAAVDRLEERESEINDLLDKRKTIIDDANEARDKAAKKAAEQEKDANEEFQKFQNNLVDIKRDATEARIKLEEESIKKRGDLQTEAKLKEIQLDKEAREEIADARKNFLRSDEDRQRDFNRSVFDINREAADRIRREAIVQTPFGAGLDLNRVREIRRDQFEAIRELRIQRMRANQDVFRERQRLQDDFVQRQSKKRKGSAKDIAGRKRELVTERAKGIQGITAEREQAKAQELEAERQKDLSVFELLKASIKSSENRTQELERLEQEFKRMKDRTESTDSEKKKRSQRRRTRG